VLWNFGTVRAYAKMKRSELLSKVLGLLSLSMLVAGVGLAVGLQQIRSGSVAFLFLAIIRRMLCFSNTLRGNSTARFLWQRASMNPPAGRGKEEQP
jgi:hypothetical protein